MARNPGRPRRPVKKKSQRDSVTGKPSVKASRARKPDGNTGRAHGGKPKPFGTRWTVPGS